MSLFFDERLHHYYFNDKKVPAVSDILVDLGFVNTTFFTEEGRERGKGIHKVIENHCRGAHCIAIKKEWEPYIQAFKNFEKDCDWKAEYIELAMGCPTYAGTADQIGKFEGKEAILDVKTGAISAATGLQLAAYEKLYRIYRLADNALVFDDDPVYEPPLPPMKRFALQLTETGRYILTEYKSRQDKYIWDSAVAIYHWKNNMRGK